MNIHNAELCKFRISHYFLMLLLFTSGCKNSEIQENKFSENDLLRKSLPAIKVPDQTTNLSGFISSHDVSFIPLDPGPDITIAEVGELKIYDHKYFIHDRITHSFLSFDEKGKLLHSYSRQGSGPGEFNNISAVNINKFTENIEIYDRSNQQILHFDLSGKFLSNRKTETYFDAFISTGKEQYILQLCSDLPEDHNFMLENKGTISKRFLPVKGMDNLEMNFRLTENNGHILLTHGSSNFVYILQEQEIIPRYYVDFGTRNLPGEILRKQEIGPKEFFKILVKNYGMIIFNFYEDDKFITFSYMVKKKPYWAIYDKKTEKTTTGNILFFDHLEIFPVYKKDEWYYSVVVPELARENISGKEPSGPLEKAIKKLVDESAPDNQNPVLIRFRLKDNLSIL